MTRGGARARAASVRGALGAIAVIACLGPVQAWAGPTEPVAPEQRGAEQYAGEEQGVAPEQQMGAGVEQGVAPEQQMGAGVERGFAPAQPMVLGAEESVAAAEAGGGARSRLIMVGAGLLGTFWVASVLTAGLYEMDRATVTPGKCLNPCVAPGDDRGGRAALFFPVAGPFIAMGTSDPSAAEAAGMAALGVGQMVGVALLTGGLLMPRAMKPQATKQQTARRVHVTPSLSPGRIGLSVSGRM